YPLVANAVQRLLTAMVGQDREEANRLQQVKWELTSRIRDESNVPNAFHFSRRSPLFTRFRPSGSRRGVGDDGSGGVGPPDVRSLWQFRIASISQSLLAFVGPLL